MERKLIVRSQVALVFFTSLLLLFPSWGEAWANRAMKASPTITVVCATSTLCKRAGKDLDGRSGWDLTNAQGVCQEAGKTYYSHQTKNIKPGCGCGYGLARWNGVKFTQQDYNCICGTTFAVVDQVICK